MHIAIVGATGMVGQTFVEVLQERNLPIKKIDFVASENSKGNMVDFNDRKYPIITIEECLRTPPDFALFSAGASLSKLYAPKFTALGSIVIDNSSAFRMDKNIKLIVPEINGDTITPKDKIIANPNCSTIQLLMPIAPLHKKFKLKRMIVSTYQSVTGTGKEALQQMWDERNQKTIINKAYPHQIDLNLLPHCDIFLENGYTKEEMKIVQESHKILNDYSIRISATAVRVPVKGGHAESVNLEFEDNFDLDEIKEILSQTAGVVVQDDPSNNLYPMPVFAEGKNEVFVGRIRKDLSHDNGLKVWIVSDNLRKGAATNALQILEKYKTKCPQDFFK